MTDHGDHDTRPDLVVRGRLLPGTAARRSATLSIVLTPVVPDDQVAQLIHAFVREVRADDDGRFVERIDLSDDVRAQLTGWIECSVLLASAEPGVVPWVKTARWMRSSSSELIAALNALLGTATLTSAPSQHDTLIEGSPQLDR